MRNDVLPSLPSQLYIFGNNEVQMPNSNVSPQMDRKGNAYGSSICIDAKVFNIHNQLANGDFAIPSHSLVNYQPGEKYQTPMSSYGNIPQQSMLLGKKPQVPQFEAGFQAMPNARKRPIEINNLLSEKGSNDLVGSKTALNEGMKNKKKKVVCSEKLAGHHQVKGKPMEVQEYRSQVPVKRSQKLSDRITALQKLVSPYGKTDTASVLQEASAYIKLLQERIWNMYEMLSSSHISVRPPNPQDGKNDGIAIIVMGGVVDESDNQ
ncbi:hypothetical protein L1049_011360 [Liquidambar formosana]|uniref:BHLH domain-containing protein n=1 Tax=Liquidambar formosana TaxID=63359 RepID=A0AAP0RWV3_LIQFO